jgi:spore coat protein U-like protein
MRRGRAIALLLMFCAGVAAPGDAWALLVSCTVAAVPVNFGIYNPVSATADTATGTVTVTCTGVLGIIGLLESWTIDLGTGNGGGYSPRLMSSGTSTLSYNLYTSAAYSSVWGNGSGATSSQSGSVILILGSNIVNYTVYGQIPAQQNAAPGSYTDSIIVTLNY